MNEIVTAWFPVVAWLFGVAGLVAALYFRVTARDEAAAAVAEATAAFTRRMDAADAAYEKLENKVVDHDRRLISVEKALEYFPTSRDIARLGDKLAEMAGDMKELRAEMKNVKEGQVRTEHAMTVMDETLRART